MDTLTFAAVYEILEIAVYVAVLVFMAADWIAGRLERKEKQ